VIKFLWKRAEAALGECNVWPPLYHQHMVTGAMAEPSVGCGQRSFNRLNKAASTL
jgi:hypothetical protein